MKKGPMRWSLIPVLIFSIPLVAILSSQPTVLMTLILGAAAAFIAKSPIGEAVAERIRQGGQARHDQDKTLGTEYPSEPRRTISPEVQRKLQTNFPAGIVVIMFTDMENFTRYIERGDEEAYQVLQRHNQVIRAATQRGGGHIVKSYGDGFMIAFSSTRQALLSAKAIQERFRSAADRLDKGQIRVRIGLDAGEPLREGHDYIGRAVNLAARISALADGGQILISETVKQLAGPLSGLQYLDRGLQALKGFAEKQRLYEVAPIEALAYPLDSEIERGLAELERQVRDEGG